MFESICSTKDQKQDSRGKILHVRCKHRTAYQFEGQNDCSERDWISVGINPLLK